MQRLRDRLTRLVRIASLIGLCTTPGLPALAQENAFAPAITVSGRVVSGYELAQRAMLFSLLDPRVDAGTEARKSLIDDRLRQFAAEAAGITVSEPALMAGMEEFASRANLTAEEFIAALAERGVAFETFRDFISSGLLWREVIRQEFLSITPVTDREIDRAIAGGIAAGGALKVLLSEIVIPTEGDVDALRLAQRIKGDVVSVAGFAAAARVHSAAPTASQGGLLDWTELGTLPAALSGVVAALQVGQMSEPVQLDGSVILLFMRDRSATTGPGTGAMTVDFVTLAGAGKTDAARCEDLLALGRNLPEEASQRQTLLESSVPGPISAVLRGLDANESAVYTSSAGQSGVVMLCARYPLTEFAASRDDIRGQLLNQKMAIRAQSFLDKLRSEAFITEP